MERIYMENSTAYVDIYRPVTEPKAAVIVCPGGGYGFVADREAEPVAMEFVKGGYLAVVLWYEVSEPVLGNIPVQQLSDTVCWLKDQGNKYRISGKHVYVCGFSAGGHLAGSLGILWNKKEYFRPDTDLNRHRPDGMILCYPVISSGEFAHRGSFERLAGEDLKAQEHYSLEKYVDAETVPAFLWGTFADEMVPVENSLLLLNQLAKHKISVEYHLFPDGVHGLSLATKEVDEPEADRLADEHVARWMPLCLEWLDHVMEKCK